MDGENNGKSYEKIDDLGGFPPIFGNTYVTYIWSENFPILWWFGHWKAELETWSSISPSHRIHVYPWDWYIYLHEWLIFMVSM